MVDLPTADRFLPHVGHRPRHSSLGRSTTFNSRHSQLVLSDLEDPPTPGRLCFAPFLFSSVGPSSRPVGHWPARAHPKYPPWASILLTDEDYYILKSGSRTLYAETEKDFLRILPFVV